MGFVVVLACSRHMFVRPVLRMGLTFPTLFAALEVATGKVVDAGLPRHRHQEFLRFLRQVAKAYPRRELHIVCDNYATHNHPTVKAWLARNPRITLHFTHTRPRRPGRSRRGRPAASGR